MERPLNVLVADAGGTDVKILATRQSQEREFRWPHADLM